MVIVQKEGRATTIGLMLLIFFLALPSWADAEVYMIRDSRGIVYFTNNKSANGKAKVLRTYNYSGPVTKIKTRRYRPIPRNWTFSSRYDWLIRAAAIRHQLDPKLLKAVIKVESNFNPYSISRTGARGLMQLMPATASAMKVRSVFSPEDNINGGAKYLRKMLDRFHNNQRLALAAYNAGPTAVDRAGGVPNYPETIRYIKKVTAAYQSLTGNHRGFSPNSATYYTYQDRQGRTVLSDRY